MLQGHPPGLRKLADRSGQATLPSGNARFHFSKALSLSGEVSSRLGVCVCVGGCVCVRVRTNTLAISTLGSSTGDRLFTMIS